VKNKGPPSGGGPDKVTITTKFEQQASSHISGTTSTASRKNASGERGRHTARRLDAVMAGVLTPKNTSDERGRHKALWLDALTADLDTPEGQEAATRRIVSINVVLQVARVVACLNSFSTRGWVWATQRWIAAAVDGGCCERSARSAIRVLQDRGYLCLLRTQHGNQMFRKFPPAKLAGPTGKTCRSHRQNLPVGTFRTLEKPLTPQADSDCATSLSPNLTLIEREREVFVDEKGTASASGEAAESTEEELIPWSEIELKLNRIADRGVREALANLAQGVRRRASH
jgi:hypothetical protein